MKKHSGAWSGLRTPTASAAAFVVTFALAALGTGVPGTAGASNRHPRPRWCRRPAVSRAGQGARPGADHDVAHHDPDQQHLARQRSGAVQQRTAQGPRHAGAATRLPVRVRQVQGRALERRPARPAQFEDTTVQQLVDSHSTVPVQDCIAASHYPLSGYLARALAFYRYHGVQQSMPWAVSNVIMYYNPVAFQKAGLNPDAPPQTFAQVSGASKKIVATHAATHGVALPAKPYVFEFLLAKSGGQYVNNGNGRTARATAAGLTSPTSLKVWRWWNQMLTSHLALATGSDPNNIDHLIAIATGNAAMTFEASGIIGPAEAVLASGQYPGANNLRSGALLSCWTH